MNWGDCKLNTLQKIDPATSSLAPTRNTRSYLNAMVAVANRGLQDLATAGKYIVKAFDIVQSTPRNLLLAVGVCEHDFDAAYEAIGATSYYFEVSGTATIEIYVDNVLTVTIQNAERCFVAHKGLIPNPNKKPVKLIFTGLYHYQYKNVALYNVNFETVDDIWDFVNNKRYDLRKIASDFYKLATTDVVFQSGDEYLKTSDYFWEGDSVLVLNGFTSGNWKVHYYAYPQEITKDIPDDTELVLDPEVAALLPLYMASQLMQDDDMGQADYFRQEYDEGKQRLQPTQSVGKAQQLVDVNGW